MENWISSKHQEPNSGPGDENMYQDGQNWVAAKSGQAKNWVAAKKNEAADFMSAKKREVGRQAGNWAA